MNTDPKSRLDAAVSNLFDYYDLAQLLGQIESVLWIITALLAVIVIQNFLKMKRDRADNSEESSSWNKDVEKAYNEADYKTALNILETAQLLNPGQALITYWQGRCYFQMQDWENAVAAFEDVLKREPFYRKSVKDYMAFIELNELVPGVEGYLRKSD